ncbi:PaaI family thioesterase [Halobacillus shinanisalinarum]|uniref:PaaI family thioesterase n=1 Tax=Halobacillus shinanisalinarum TaxID=2932258 RepID=A0ABY4H360_9BACI|nr:PaaI family thioesterase [Halobacillus shinanisalinarum]UOQ94885.1 PaaI family thioesterase [Halobacillus shinanisalinarum]
MNSEEEKKSMINRVRKKLPHYSLEELSHVEDVLDSLQASKSSELYYFAKFLGIDWTDGRAAMRLDLQHANTYGVAQGGTVYTLADFAMGYKVLSGVSEDKQVYTLEMKMNYISPGKGEQLIAVPELLHVGNRTAVLTCEVKDENSNLIAHAQGTFYMR